MVKKIVLEFDPENANYVAKNVGLDKMFFVDLREKGYIDRAFSFEDLPSVFLAEVIIEDNNSSGKDFLEVKIHTDAYIPKKWNQITEQSLNKDLIVGLNGHKKIGCVIRLGKENVIPIKKGVSLLIEIPL